jgi:RimJ/RimL family protein N-acetyltransferase/methionyl-tRNA formyltransferase
VLPKMPLVTERLTLRSLSTADVGERYVGWLNDPLINRFLEVRYAAHSIESTRDFVRSINDSPDSELFGIFLAETGDHIGNIKIGPVNRAHRRAEVGLLLGERPHWGKGFATEAIAAVTGYAFRELGLEKLTAGCYQENVGSRKAFLKAGYVDEATLPGHWLVDGRRQAEFLMAALSSQWQPPGRTERFGDVQRLVLIGGGQLMLSTTEIARGLGYPVSAILAPRHAAETTREGGTLDAALRAAGCRVAVVEDINAWPDVAQVAGGPTGSVALCFGPAWIFAQSVLAAFGRGMINFNGIPIPEYLGGAHYTWQILHQNRTGGCFLQCITSEVDQGDVLRFEYFDLPPTVRTPDDYFVANQTAATAFLRRALGDFRSGAPFSVTPYAPLNRFRLYFPRLRTALNGWIDWSWTAAEIERFCCAFDDPYAGAGTFCREREVRLSCVSVVPEPRIAAHPFSAGLIVRKAPGRIWVMARDGLLSVGSLRFSNGEDALARCGEGDRLVTPPGTLFQALGQRARLTATGFGGELPFGCAGTDGPQCPA